MLPSNEACVSCNFDHLINFPATVMNDVQLRNRGIGAEACLHSARAAAPTKSSTMWKGRIYIIQLHDLDIRQSLCAAIVESIDLHHLLDPNA